MGMGVSESDAKHFDAGLRAGGTLVTVNAGQATPAAVDILERHGADLGPSSSESPTRMTGYEGEERRTHDDPSYTGPERRLVGV
jgi:hypothetical protein